MYESWTQKVLAEVALPDGVAQVIDYHFDAGARTSQHVADVTVRWRLWPNRVRLRSWQDGGTPMAGGKMMFIPAPTQINAEGSSDEERTRSLSLRIPPERFERITDFALSSRIGAAAMCTDFHNINIEHAMRRMSSEIVAPGLCSRAVIEGCSLLVMAELVRHFDDPRPSSPDPQSLLSAKRVRQVEDFVLAYTGGSPTPSEIAAELRIGVSHLRQSFKASTGKTLFQFIEEVRVARAKALLEDPALPLKGVAHELGFATPSAFSQAFRRVTGLTPRAYRIACS